MMVRAKMILNQRTEIAGINGGSWKLSFNAVTSGSEENKQFFASTPSGSIEVWVKKDIADRFEVGKEYYIDFVPASPNEPT